MELKNIFKMTKTDRYTQDGRDELAKLQETEDVKYKTGDISQKTGLQKQPDGSWAPPKKGAGNKSAEENKINETINAKRAQQKEAEKAEYNRNIRSFYDNTGLKGGPEEVLVRKEAEKADRKQENLQPGKRDDSMFKEKDKVEFARHGKYMNGEIESIRKDWKGNVSMQVKGEDGKSYFVEAGDITKHKPSGESKPDDTSGSVPQTSNQSVEEFLRGSEPTPGSLMRAQQQQIMKANDNNVIIKRKHGMISLYGAKNGAHIADFATEKDRLDFMKENNLSKPDNNQEPPRIIGGEKTIERFKNLYDSAPRQLTGDCKIRIRK